MSSTPSLLKPVEASGSTRYDPSTVYYQAFDTKGVLLQGVLKLVHASRTWVGIRQGEKGKQELLELGFNDVRPVNIVDLTKPPVTEAETKILQHLENITGQNTTAQKLTAANYQEISLIFSQLLDRINKLDEKLAKLTADNDLWGTVTKSVQLVDTGQKTTCGAGIAVDINDPEASKYMKNKTVPQNVSCATKVVKKSKKVSP